VTEGTFFSLIDGKQVRLAPRKRVLSSEAFETLCGSKELLELVQEDAKKYRAQVVSDCEAIKERAEKEGFQAGFDAWVDQLSQLEKEIQNVRDELQKVVLPVAIKAAQKIVTTQLTVDPEIIKEIVSNTLKTVSQHKNVTLYVSKQDYGTIEKEKPKFISEEMSSFSLREREDLNVGDCIIVTEGGIVNARIEDRWKKLTDALEFVVDRVKEGAAE